jgi:hypothetical protein
MKTKIILLLITASYLFCQDVSNELDFTTEIEVEKEEPRVSISASRKIPEFPELPITRDYMDDILNRFDNKTYFIERRKIVIIANIETELENFN